MSSVEHGHDPNDWLTLAEAAERLGVSIYTVRRQVKRGELEAQQVATRHGLTWRVRLGNLPGGVVRVSDEVKQAGEGPATLELIRLVDQYRVAEERHRQEMMELAGRIGYLQAELAQARDTIKMLQAPEESEAVQESTLPTEAVSRPATSLWSRLAGWFGG